MRSPDREARSVIHFVDRRTGELREEVVLGAGFIRWAYEHALGRALRRALLTRSEERL